MILDLIFIAECGYLHVREKLKYSNMYRMNIKYGKIYKISKTKYLQCSNYETNSYLDPTLLIVRTHKETRENFHSHDNSGHGSFFITRIPHVVLLVSFCYNAL